MEPFGCYGLKIVIHGPDCEEKQAKYMVNGWDDTYWLEAIDQVLTVIRQDLERDPDAQSTEDLVVELRKELEGYKADAGRMRRKLKAVEAWFESERGYNLPGFEKLGKILGKEAS